MTLWIATLLGAVQGIFMFLPVSSTAHLVLTQHWLIGQGHLLPAPESAEMILFDLVVHVGTLVSIAIVFWSSLTRLSGGIARQSLQWASRQGTLRPELLYLRLTLLCALSVLATAAVGLLLKTTFERVFALPLLVVGTLTVTGLLLWWTDTLGARPRGLRQITPRNALVIGAAQGLALVPGFSRSGLTISAALLSGLKRRWAAEYSFFLAIPTILAATAVQAIEVARNGGLSELDYGVMLTAFVVAAAIGTLALRLVLYFLYRARMKVFSFYLWALAAAVLLGVINLG
ncbi:undecaprenyl-diphosphate phosphatase [Halomonas campisalis]|uniref:Undecaprenyl-diphosphatase n=1 Tax=Billgrantia campisalis TaxID=74661 RepID=A0ABS9PAT3_9GAMM|nr:undecaprenyl-diphosphate phosphatase [Halomonas campisalis]MCG6658589.1 undecaprenyl-diphosphate phosphatase [Halomonas campisalis]MDR5863451.1 undecaprenyl-diphosphate phosphatase [Halomonas campisalis]